MKQKKYRIIQNVDFPGLTYIFSLQELLSGTKKWFTDSDPGCHKMLGKAPFYKRKSGYDFVT
jgi:hypothetical protein